MEEIEIGFRLLITGKTRSGKSTALHHLTTYAVRLGGWDEIIVLDGKGSEMHIYNTKGIIYYGADEIHAWADVLSRISDELPSRYKNLTQRGLRKASLDDPRKLIIIDEVQRGTRAAKPYGGKIYAALQLIAEQSAALGDVIIISTQRDVASVPPAVRFNSNARLFMLGLGFFQYQMDGQQTKSGRTEYIDIDAIPALLDKPLDANAPAFNAANIPLILNSKSVSNNHANVKLFLGPQGSGRTFALWQSANGHRVVYLDLALPHRDNLVAILEQCRAVAPMKAPIHQLAEAAALALQSEQTTLLLDNADKASEKILNTTVPLLINAASDVFISADDSTPLKRRKIDPLIPRCTVERLQPLTAEQTKKLLWSQINRDEVRDPRAVEKRILSISGGHPATVVSLAQRVRKGNLAELRDFYAPPKRVNLIWVILLIALIALVLMRYNMDEPTIAAILLIATLIIRRLAMRSMTTPQR